MTCCDLNVTVVKLLEVNGPVLAILIECTLLCVWQCLSACVCVCVCVCTHVTFACQVPVYTNKLSQTLLGIVQMGPMLSLQTTSQSVLQNLQSIKYPIATTS